MAGKGNTDAGPEAGPQAGESPKIKWDDSALETTYANVVNVTSTREEVYLFFGTNRAWMAGQSELTVQLTDRMILNPFAAKRLLGMLATVLKEYESRYGSLDQPAREPPAQG